MPPISFLIKPSSSNCNLNCTYCFYRSLSDNRETYSYGYMDLKTLETIVKKGLEFADGSCTFGFQGGEPTLIGLDFYKELISYEKKYNKKSIQINNAIQTNGMVIDDEWAKFLSENNFLVGLSLDGPKNINDLYREDFSHGGSFGQIMKTINLFNKYDVQYNILSVVTYNSSKHISKIYNFFKKHKLNYLQFIPCLDPLDEVHGENIYSLTSSQYGDFLNTLFDHWYRDIIKGETISIRYFENIITLAMGYNPESCGIMGICAFQFVIEANGDVYPCDFYVTDEWKAGNILEDSIIDLRNSKVAKEFIEPSYYVDSKCKECRWLQLCRGGCRRHREPFIDDKLSLNYYCQAYEKFFDYTGERIYELARRLSGR